MNVLRRTSSECCCTKTRTSWKNARGKVCLCFLGWKIYFRTRRTAWASFEGHLKKKGYFASITTTWSLIKQEKFFNPSKRAKKARKRNKPNASVTLTSEELKVLYNKGLLSMCGPEALLSMLWLNNTLHFGLPWVQRTSWYVLGRC